MKTITLFLGKSGAGKDYYLKKYLSKHDNAKAIVSITTRPPRPNEKNGVDYHFISEDAFWACKLTGQLIEYREYQTKFGEWLYATPSFVNNIYNDYVGVVDINGAIDIIKYYCGCKDIIIRCYYINTNDDIRIQRAIDRGGFNESEWNRRMITDNNDFSEEKLNNLNNELKKHNYPQIKVINNN